MLNVDKKFLFSCIQKPLKPQLIINIQFYARITIIFRQKKLKMKMKTKSEVMNQRIFIYIVKKLADRY